jgi:phage baseplate assembly protein W
MLKSGNGEPQQCADNLLRTPRFSVPYERLKGIDGDLIDSPASTSPAEMAADAEWLLETYEPRAKINSIEAGDPDGVGDFGITADISVNYNDEEDDE